MYDHSMKTKFIGIVALGKNRQIVSYPEDARALLDSAKSSDDTVYILSDYAENLPKLSELYCYVVDSEAEGELFPEYTFYEWEVLNTEVHPAWSLYHMKKIPDYE